MSGLVAIYDDDLMALFGDSMVKIRRASHIEPRRDEDGSFKWQADLTPVGGPVLFPFKTRQEALDAEHAWIESNVINPETKEI